VHLGIISKPVAVYLLLQDRTELLFTDWIQTSHYCCKYF